MATISIFALAPVAPVGNAVLMNPANLGNYGTNDQDVVIPGAQPSVQNNLPLVPPQPIIPWDANFIPWNVNPIDRQDYPNPVPVPALVTFTNRNKLLKMLEILMVHPNQRRNLAFQVSRVVDVIYYLDGPLGEAPGPVVDGNGHPAADQEGGYGIPFENVITHDVTPHLEKYFVFQSYDLVGVTPLLVRTEVDCVNQANAITEIKSRRAPNYSIWNDVRYFRGVWAQMLFGCTQSLVLGTYTTPPNQVHPPATFNNIYVRTFAEVQGYAKMDQNNDVAPLSMLAALVNWIRDHIADGETRTFAFAAFTQEFSLT